MGAEIFDEPGNKNFLEEWKIVRSILKEFDEHLHDLRKYGFTFLTALLAAQYLLFPTWLPVSDSKVLPDYIKLAVLIINFLLILGLQVLDRNYIVFQYAATDRGKILERILNLELTEVIAQRFAQKNIQEYVTVLYLAFTCGVVFLGSAVLFPNWVFIFILIFSGFITSVFVIELFRSINLNYPYGKMDWTLDRLQCDSGDEIAITLTNLGENALTFPSGTIMWQIVKQDEENPVKTEKTHTCLIIPAESEKADRARYSSASSYTWLWKTDKGLKAGIYRVDRATIPQEKEKKKTIDRKEKYPLKPLNRKLRIRTPNN